MSIAFFVTFKLMLFDSGVLGVMIIPANYNFNLKPSRRSVFRSKSSNSPINVPLCTFGFKLSVNFSLVFCNFF